MLEKPISIVLLANFSEDPQIFLAVALEGLLPGCAVVDVFVRVVRSMVSSVALYLLNGLANEIFYKHIMVHINPYRTEAYLNMWLVQRIL